MELTREQAWALLTEFTQNDNLQKHALAVDAAVRGYARQFGEDETAWGVTALLHDFDYDRYPDLADHPFKGALTRTTRAWRARPGWSTPCSPATRWRAS
jgi:predicted hydrolase (HD superfamily)